jgi:DNA (cytosine-5)-methyltransferase 1
MNKSKSVWYEFFSGGGMARLGLGTNWRCAFANDNCEKKVAAYRGYFGPSPELRETDVGNLTTKDLPGIPNLVWASFPCQDLSLAGNGAGLDGHRSGTFRPFWKLVQGLVREGRAPKLIVLENVTGALTSHSGRDFKLIIKGFVESGYRVGALVIDAAEFLPQSRPRLFIIGCKDEAPLPTRLVSSLPTQWHTRSLVNAQRELPEGFAKNWVWWLLPKSPGSVPSLNTIIEKEPTGVNWHSDSETQRLLELMAPIHRKKVRNALRAGGRHVGTIYKRTRPDRKGMMSQRAEVRFDGVAGCLRTPVGGSSRQTVIVVENAVVRTRLLSPREAARLMGVPNSYPLPPRYNDAYHLFGDGLAVPVVSWLERHLLWPLVVADSIEQVA